MAKTNFKQLKAVENIQLNTDGSIVIKLNQEETPQNLILPKEIQFEKDRLSQTEAANLFQVTVQTIINWSKKGIISKYKLGNRVFYLRSELLEAARQNNNMLKV
ncbi:helix-turn-helix domain-containing protein [Dysgonomonas massiliensis]|uniref:helix-turn-helix domain-containing protein n=1 Tax=Dysgonomonas massiliensis TaxID=2040292 RepID=UPI000C767176|nr:helix-turn-helix domain-containing protein [Dysgonomonas massiliensis]